MLTIGQLAKSCGVKVPTIRYYEQMGLIDAPGRSAGNQRRYDKAALNRLRFIRHARDLGLDLAAIKVLFSLDDQPNLPCAAAHEIAQAHLADIRRRMRWLQGLETELTRITQECSGDTIGACNVMASLADHQYCAADHSKTEGATHEHTA
ncbi:MAG: helix-turn-helix domain-containing protein [Paracoccaceae bacterium]